MFCYPNLNFFFILIFFLFYSTVANAQNTSLTISLDKRLTITNRELYGDFINLNHTSTVQVNIQNVNKNISFIIFHVHSHIYNITLYNNTYQHGSYVNGTNVGLYSSVKQGLDTFYIYNPNESVDLKLYISIHGYRDKAPIPGGCNMEFPVYISPFIKTTFNKDYIMIFAPPAKYYKDKSCDLVNMVHVQFYRMFLPEKNYNRDAYFEGIRKMITWDKITENGELIPVTSQTWNMRRMLSAYTGTGSVYVAIAISGANEYSVYVPTYTYACSPLDEGDCDLLDDTLSQLLCASLLFIGIYICYFGHRFFKTEMFIFGMLSGFVFTYILFALITNLERPTLVSASFSSGIFFGAIWLLFWWFYGIPVLSVLLCNLNLGFLFASIVYYSLPETSELLQVDFNFWTLFIMMMLLISLLLVSVTFLSNILCCALLGAYAIVYPMDYYIGSNLKYIMINIVRRATVPKFNKAVVAPPFEMNDALITTLWVFLAITGFLFQHYHNRGRPPFPPPPRNIGTWVREEPTSTITHGRYRRYGSVSGNENINPTPSAPPALYNDRTPLLA